MYTRLMTLLAATLLGCAECEEPNHDDHMMDEDKKEEVKEPEAADLSGTWTGSFSCTDDVFDDMAQEMTLVVEKGENQLFTGDLNWKITGTDTEGELTPEPGDPIAIEFDVQTGMQVRVKEAQSVALIIYDCDNYTFTADGETLVDGCDEIDVGGILEVAWDGENTLTLGDENDIEIACAGTLTRS